MVPDLQRRLPGCGILVAGSVQRGEERPDSDLDLFVVFPGDGRLGLTHETSPEGVKIDLAVFPEDAFLRQLPAEWFNFWMFSRAEVVHDPAGIAGRCRDLARARFRERPDVDAAWERQFAEVRRHKADRSHALEFWTWDDFSRHIRELAAKSPGGGNVSRSG